MRHKLMVALWLASDILLFLGTYALAYFLRVGWIFSTDFLFAPYLLIVCMVAPLWLLVLLSSRAFALTRRQQSLRNGAHILYAAVVGVALFALGYYFTFGLFFSRKLLLYALILNTGTTWLWHVLYEKVLRAGLRREPPVFRALVVGITRESRALIEELNRSQNPITPIAILDGRGVKDVEIHGVPVEGKLNRIEEIMREKEITHVIQCAELEQSLNLLSICRQFGAIYMLLPSVLGIVERDERVESLEGHPVTIVNPGEQKWQWFFR
ncbi:MAG: hypothetical protein PHU04_05145 [Candidatus Peribacteraceae bacterium]|nr:hypothetical protein [Candidatus Peribacteraceae bacterium]